MQLQYSSQPCISQAHKSHTVEHHRVNQTDRRSYDENYIPASDIDRSAILRSRNVKGMDAKKTVRQYYPMSDWSTETGQAAVFNEVMIDSTRRTAALVDRPDYQ